MGKESKLQLKELKVQSFVTETEKKNLKGGLPYTCDSCQMDCSYTYIWWCPPTATDDPLCHTACACA